MSEWTTTRLDRVATVKARIGWKALTADEYQDDGYVFLNTPNIKGSSIDFEAVNYIGQFRWDESPELQLRIGDVLLAKDGSTLGIANVVTELPRAATVNGSIAVVRPHGIDPRFLRYSLASAPTQSRIEELRAGMGVPHLFQRDINRLPVAFPPSEEQRRIADFLDDQVTRIDNAISARQEQLRACDEACLSLNFEAASGVVISGNRVDAAPLTWCSTLPASWRIARLSLVARMGTGHTPSRDVADYWVEDDLTVPWVSTADIVRSPYSVSPLEDSVLHISEVGLANSAAVVHPAGTVMLCRTASVGLATVTGVPAATSQRFVTWTPGPLLEAEYLLAVVRAMRPEWLRLANGSTHGTVFFPDLEGVRVPLPPRDQQRQLAAELAKSVTIVESFKSSLDLACARLEEYKQSLVTAAVTGELDVATARRAVSV